MKKFFQLGLIAAFMLLLALPAEAQQGNIAFLKISDVPGEATMAGYTDSIELISYNYALHMQSFPEKSYSSSKAPNTRITSVVIKKWLGRGSLELQKLALTGAAAREASITLCKMENGKLSPYYILKMDEVRLGNYSTSRDAGGTQESFNLSFSKMTVQYFENGKMIESYTYDLESGGQISTP